MYLLIRMIRAKHAAIRVETLVLENGERMLRNLWEGNGEDENSFAQQVLAEQFQEHKQRAWTAAA